MISYRLDVALVKVQREHRARAHVSKGCKRVAVPTDVCPSDQQQPPFAPTTYLAVTRVRCAVMPKELAVCLPDLGSLVKLAFGPSCCSARLVQEGLEHVLGLGHGDDARRARIVDAIMEVVHAARVHDLLATANAYEKVSSHSCDVGTSRPSDEVRTDCALGCHHCIKCTQSQ